MKPQGTLQHSLKKMFTWDKPQKRREASQSSPISTTTSADVRGTEAFPGGVKEWVKCDDAVVDICFIHGLTGNRDSTWTANGQQEPWPKLLLPAELSNLKARILTYGYDAYIVRWGHASSDQLTNHATNFLQKITEDREKINASTRPLIIVAHSLGGLVSKQAVLDSKNSPDAHLQNLYNATTGIIFMGTPHMGSWIADWAKIPVEIFGILKSTNTSLLRALQTKDELLKKLNKDFLSLLRSLREGPTDGKKIEVICFYESLGYPKFGHVVSEDSATFASDAPISIHANHSNMVKFATATDDGFQSVAANLRRWTNASSTQDATTRALKLLLLPGHSRKTLEYCLKALDLEDAAVSLLEYPVTNPEPKPVRQQSIEREIKDTYQRATERCRQSLSFDDMMLREDTIARPEEQTCRWIYEDSRYWSWITNQKPLLWIKGKPGSGKSILLKSLFQHRQALFQSSQELFQQRQELSRQRREKRLKDLYGPPTILLRFFFNARGSKMEKSREALYRTLLHNLLQSSPPTMCEVLALYLDKETRSSRVRWQTNELADIFHDKIEHFMIEDLEIMIDALDECSDEEVLQIVRRFETSIQKSRPGNALRVCWSSRFYPHISLRAVQGIELVVNEKNSHDINEYLQNILPLDFLDPELQFAADEIVSRSKGVFLWATMVANKLVKAFNTGKYDATSLKVLLRTTPDGLDNYFMDIFKTPAMTEEQRDDLQRIACFVLGATRPLSLGELRCALLLSISSGELSLDESILEWPEAKRFQKRVTHASGGLFEVISVNTWSVGGLDRVPSTRVQVIHESVREFFLGIGLSILQSPSREIFLKKCSSEITRAAFNGLSRITSYLHETQRHQCESPCSRSDETLNSFIPKMSWYPPTETFLRSYVVDNVFSHLDEIFQPPIDDLELAKWLPPSDVCEKALHGYLRIACFEIFHRGGLTKAMTNQLNVALDHHKLFCLDNNPFANLLDFPNRLMVCLEFFERRGIYLAKQSPGNEARAASTRPFVAVFFARFDRAKSAKRSEEDPEGFHLLLAIHFSASDAEALQLAVPGRLAALKRSGQHRPDIVTNINITHWHVNSAFEKDGLYEHAEGQLTFSTPSALSCKLYTGNFSNHLPSSFVEAKFVLVQEAREDLQRRFVSLGEDDLDRVRLFVPLGPQGTEESSSISSPRDAEKPPRRLVQYL